MSSDEIRARETYKYDTAYQFENYRTPKHALQNRGKLMDRIGKGETYLDISTGRGETVALARRKGINAAGTEFTQALCNDYVRWAAMPELEGIEPHDYVSCYEILEHLPPHDLLPSLDRLCEITKKQLWITTNDKQARTLGESGEYHNLHISRCPLSWWIFQLDRLGEKYGARPHWELWRPHNPQARNWFFCLDFTKSYDIAWVDDLSVEKSMREQGYSPDTLLYHFWYHPKFPIAELMQLGWENKDEEKYKPGEAELYEDIASRGVQSPILVHNIPNQHARRYWVRDGNHRVRGALLAGKRTIPAVIFGCTEYLQIGKDKFDRLLQPYTIKQVNDELLKDGRIVMYGDHPPRLEGASWPGV